MCTRPIIELSEFKLFIISANLLPYLLHFSIFQGKDIDLVDAPPLLQVSPPSAGC